MKIFILYKVDIVKLLNYVDRHILRNCVFNQTAHDWNVFYERRKSLKWTIFQETEQVGLRRQQ